MCAQPWKDFLDSEAVALIGRNIHAAHPDFDTRGFHADCREGLDRMELKDRVLHIAGALRKYLPEDRVEALAVIRRAGEAWPPRAPTENTLNGFVAWPMIDWVGLYGLDHPEDSLETLRRITHLFSAEFAIRPFLIHHTELTLARLKVWTEDENEHVRRLVSEGTRPRVPWGVRLKQFEEDPEPTLSLLERLKDDSSDYVRRSVANHLNDMSKVHPDTVVAICRRWKKGASKERQWIIRHATRSLVKQGDPATLELLGFGLDPQLKTRRFSLSPESLRIGEELTFTLDLVSTSDEPQNIVIDYAVHYRRANGGTSPKVFKLKTLELGAGESLSLRKRHSFRPVTTRRHYPGGHAIEVMANGRTLARKTFELLP